MKVNKVVQYYDELAHEYDQNRFNNSYGRFIDYAERAILTELLSTITEDHCVVDLPCGTGRLTSFATIGIDASIEMIKQAQIKYPQKIFYHTDAAQLPLADQSVDVIFSFHFFMHLDRAKTEEIFAEFYRVLKPNGRVIFDIPSQKRRAWGRRDNTGWHGDQAMSSADVAQIQGFQVKQSYGLLWLPIHRFPKKCRSWLNRFDAWLGRSSVKEYSSYLIFELVKK